VRASLPTARSAACRPEEPKIARPMVNNQPLVPAKPVPPGWKRRLYGRQDARRYRVASGAFKLIRRNVHSKLKSFNFIQFLHDARAEQRSQR